MYADTADCYKYEFDLDEWILSGTMTRAKAYGGYDSSEEWGLILVGGDGTNVFSSVETTNNGEVFDSLPDLPEATWDFCALIIDQDRIFTCGGYWSTGQDTKTLIFQKSTNSWNT